MDFLELKQALASSEPKQACPAVEDDRPSFAELKLFANGRSWRHEFRPDRVKRYGFDSIYSRYLKSPDWKDKKRKVIKRDRCCRLCGSTKSLQVHHIHYKNVGDEPLEDLTLLCKSCHSKFHQQ